MTKKIVITVADRACPRCGAPEVNPDTDKLFVRGFKVHSHGKWQSHCMRCHIWFDEDDNVSETCPDDCYCQDLHPGTPTHYVTGEPI